MASTPIVDFDALLAPIGGDDPSGSGVPFTTKETLEAARKEINPDDFDESDPTRPTEFKRADWPTIIRLCEVTLQETSKDLMVAARLLEALVKTHGFAGLRDGLTLLRRLVEECWDRIRPPIDEDGDVEPRAAPFNWLDDPDRGARFPTTIRQIILVADDEAAYSFQSWRELQAGKGKVKKEDIDRAITVAPREICQANSDDLDASMAEIATLLATLDAKMGDYAPSMLTMRQAVEECRSVAQQILARKGPAPVAAGDLAAGEAGAEGGPAAGGDGAGGIALTAAGAIATRAHVYRRLSESASLLQQMEPHSPIPYIIHRAVQLGDLPFPDLMKALISDLAVLHDMGRRLGIRELEPGSEEEE